MPVSESFSPDYHGSEASQIGILRPSGSGSSGLKLVLPALKNLKPIKAGKKLKRNASAVQGEYGVQEEEKKAPRPVKLKPLKEVLTKLIAQIKKKDDYAFFLKPVDVSQTPGYSDIVKRPMDLGTMTVKVNKGKYRSLEEFASDLRLVTSNAKLFNPPGTIYYTEAEKIEAWSLDHIAKAAPTVIQYETDWNIDIEKEEEGQNINIDDDDDDHNVGTPMDVDEPAPGGRSPSVASEIRPGTQRRGVRGPYKKSAIATTSSALSESIDAEGRLPGSREGLATFPPGSDWAKTMVALKLKGKRYRTKKERMRIEKEGPPLLADGSLDYTEMEDPFSVLSALAPDPLSRPYLAPLHPPLFRPVDTTYDPSSSQSQPPQPPPPYPTSINLPLDHSFPTIPPATSAPSVSKQRRHWVITRNVARAKARDKDDDQEPPDAPSWKTPREAHATDFGSFALLAGAIEDEMRRRQVGGYEGEEEEKVLEAIKESLDMETATGNAPTPDHGIGKTEYWNTERAADAEGYIRDVVYGGVTGLAYVRSLAEFVTTEQRQVGEPGPGSNSGSGLGMPLATWVEKNLVDPLTDGRHSLLRETAQQLIAQRSSNGESLDIVKQELQLEGVSAQVAKSLYVYPPATVALSALRQIRTHKIDMGALIKTPEELFLSEEEWFGKIFRERRKPRGEEPRKVSEEFEVEEPEKTWMDIDPSTKDKTGVGQDSDYELEGPEELNEVLDYVAGVIVSLDRTIRDQRPSSTPVTKGIGQEFRGFSSKALESDCEGQEKAEDGKNDIADRDGTLSVSETLEDPVLRNLRLNLLALAKRAPLDTIARLPKDLVPEHIRHFVPTLGASG
ncbi:hypothetical protein BDZ94DRAFT_1155732 [Collybia nuda]|uniref:Bromo domain-containing protein n=1 Tax=Collybia nuda TaxID=64659 RepID=A0A9P5YCJ5_9AGAR|nr:hypothetical protein BDZ94DRAFT_1155732 [Collybia nuda]